MCCVETEGNSEGKVSAREEGKRRERYQGRGENGNMDKEGETKGRSGKE